MGSVSNLSVANLSAIAPLGFGAHHGHSDARSEVSFAMHSMRRGSDVFMAAGTNFFQAAPESVASGAYGADFSNMQDFAGMRPQTPVGEELVAQLIEAERFSEALRCRKHTQAAEKVAEVEGLYRAAKEEDKLEEAIELRSQLKQLQAQLCSPTTIAAWRTPSPPATRTVDIPVSVLAEKIASSVGAAQAQQFSSKFDRNTLISAARTDLARAVELHHRAIVLSEFLLAQSQQLQAVNVQSWKRVRKQLLSDLTEAQTHLEAIPEPRRSHAEALGKSAKAQDFFASLDSMMAIALRVRAALSRAAASLDQDDQQLDVVVSRVASLLENLGHAPSVRAQDVDALVRGDDGSHDRCSLCTVATGSSNLADDLTQATATVNVAGGLPGAQPALALFHSGCANFWVHRVAVGNTIPFVACLCPVTSP
eukprot:TRINITY_DN1601_c1_g1_i14.p1 TRINITY_DN1601_c1_g1~~TRINITY_DN1601_c1_g1_i14.p1  ORF type:complete len:423 (+),score=67.17 TRINITY_DN1601_c1_g1_i14:1107-2375(+)